jgi:hypothetical protein
VIDDTTADFTKETGVYHIILDTVGATSFSRSARPRAAAKQRNAQVLREWSGLGIPEIRGRR